MADSSFDMFQRLTTKRPTTPSIKRPKNSPSVFDFKNTDTTIEWKGETDVELTSSTEDRVVAALEVFKEKVIKRGISLKAFTAGDPRQSGKLYKLQRILQQWD